MRIARFLAGGLASAALVVMLSGCAGAPPVTVFGGLSERCFPTRTTSDGYSAVVGVTVSNESPRSVILREARVVELVNASVAEVSLVRMPNVYTNFGVAPGGVLTAEQREIYSDRESIDGAVLEAGATVEVLLDLRAADYREYAGLRGLRLKYDDGWFSATSTADAVIGFVPPWAHCGTPRR